jgi:hypothetical protein
MQDSTLRSCCGCAPPAALEMVVAWFACAYVSDRGDGRNAAKDKPQVHGLHKPATEMGATDEGAPGGRGDDHLNIAKACWLSGNADCP